MRACVCVVEMVINVMILDCLGVMDVNSFDKLSFLKHLIRRYPIKTIIKEHRSPPQRLVFNKN